MDDTYIFNILSIDDLNDDCLIIHILTFLRVPDRLRIERVCKRWRSLAQVSWRRIKMLTLDNDFHLEEHIYDKDVTNANVEVLHKVLRLCGPYLCRIVFDHDCIKLRGSTMSNIQTLCPNVKEIKLNTNCEYTTLQTVMRNFIKLQSFEVQCKS